jgi:crotonobetainyl-CoA:carnitine CoA-transferase CaiB-like acyl-CoA transferase
MSMEMTLQGLKVLELGQWIAAPYCCALLGDLGADVIKVEKPGTGDDQRYSPPQVRGTSAFFRHFNRNKRSIALDLSNPDEREQCLKLIAEADVLVENFRPGVLKRLGLDYNSVRSLNQRLVYCSISGFGQTGPLSSQGGFDLVAQAASGLMSITGDIDGRPRKIPIPIADVSSALFAAIGILAAVVGAVKHGTGQQVDIALLEAALAMAPLEVAGYLATGAVPEPLGETSRNAAPYQVFRTADGALALGAATQTLWEKTCRVIGHPELLDDPRFSTNSLRVANVEELTRKIESAFLDKSAADWIAALAAEGIPAGPVWNYAEVLEHPHIAERNLVRNLNIEDGESLRQMVAPISLSTTPVTLRRSAPSVGQHSDEVLVHGWGTPK